MSKKAFLGVSGRALDSKTASTLDVEETEGFYINELEEGLGAQAAGLLPNDIIKSVDGTKINRFSDLTGYISSKRPGDRVEVVFIRAGIRKKVLVELKKRNRYFFYGLELKNLEPEEKRERDLDSGIKVTDSANRYLSMYGIGDGAVVIEINGETIKDISNLDRFDEQTIETILFLTAENERIIFRD